MEPKRTGSVGESLVIYEFAKRGIPIFLPFGDNEKIDLLAEFNGKINRIQIKTVTHSLNNQSYVVDLRACKNHKTTPETYHYTNKDIDYYVVVCLDRESVCMIPVDDAPYSSVTIRYGTPSNNQKAFIRNESDYSMDRFIK